MKRLNLTENDWLKLRDYNVVIARHIKNRLPLDWQLTTEEIEGAVYDTFIRYLNNYEQGTMSPVSWCYKYAEQATYRDLIREYRKLKAQDTFDALYGEDDDDDQPCRHKYGKGDVQALAVDDRAAQELCDEVNTILDKAPLIDREIMKLVMKGMTFEEIGREIGLSKMAVSKRLKKYSNAL